jgi:hypothetical protein
VKLLSVANAKTPKGEGRGYLTGILYLAPFTLAGVGNVCPHSTPGCRLDCLFFQGRARSFSKINAARIRKTREFMSDRRAFGALLARDIAGIVRMAQRRGLLPAVRLNGTSDLRFEAIYPGLMEAFPGVRFYDYTKDVAKVRAYLRGTLPHNYSVTFSLAETPASRAHAREVLKLGGRVAAVFRTAEFPARYLGARVIDGDETDLRFLDPPGVIVGLRAKGSARRNQTGFVIDANKGVRGVR